MNKKYQGFDKSIISWIRNQTKESLKKQKVLFPNKVQCKKDKLDDEHLCSPCSISPKKENKLMLPQNCQICRSMLFSDQQYETALCKCCSGKYLLCTSCGADRTEI